jgi:hypothetical protein
LTTEIINRVAQSGIFSLDLEEYFPNFEITVLDMKDWLFHGLILKEADFRQKLDEHDWEQYTGKAVCLICTADAIVPLWAYMLFASRLQPFAAAVHYGSIESYLESYYDRILSELNVENYKDKRIVIKGCGDKPVPASAYVVATGLLLPYAKSIMFGEPCSTVPVYKRKK